MSPSGIRDFSENALVFLQAGTLVPQQYYAAYIVVPAFPDCFDSFFDLVKNYRNAVKNRPPASGILL